jgi:hypothetical protein
MAAGNQKGAMSIVRLLRSISIDLDQFGAPMLSYFEAMRRYPKRARSGKSIRIGSLYPNWQMLTKYLAPENR